MDSSQLLAVFRVDGERLENLGGNGVVGTRLDTGAGGVCVAVHRIALPDDFVAGFLDGFYVRGEVVADFGGAVAGDEGYLSGLPIGIDDVEQWPKLAWIHRGSDLDSNRIGDTAEVLHMRAIQLSRPISNPDKMSRGIEPLLVSLR